MKEFIEKMIEMLEEEIENVIVRDTYTKGKNAGLRKAKIIVNNLAEEYNNDFCEWHKVKNGNAYKCNTHAEIHDSRVLDWHVCPYCGKKIKVVE